MDFVDERAVEESHGWLVDNERAMAAARRSRVAREEMAKIVLSHERSNSRRKTVAEREDEARCSDAYREARDLFENAIEIEETLNLKAKNHAMRISIWQSQLKLTRM